MGVVRNIRALFPIRHPQPSERQIVSYIQKCYLIHDDADDDADDDIECEEGEEYDVVDFDDVDDSDDEEGFTWIDAAVGYLSDEGAVDPSSWPTWSRGTWYEAGNESWDMHGEIERRSYHLKGFTEAEEEEIFRVLKHGKRI